jgi:diguanylate cyclase (GGDEF)-like protein
MWLRLGSGFRLGNGYYLLCVNITLALLVAGGFAAAYGSDRRRKQALYWIAGALCVAADALVEAFIPFINMIPVARVATFTFFLLSLTFMTAGIAVQYKQKLPLRSVACLFAGSVVLNILILELERNAPIRIILHNAPYVAMVLISIALILKSPRKKWLDYLFLADLVLIGAHFALRPLSAALLGGMGDTAADYLRTSYAAFDQMILSVLGMGLVALMAATLVREVFRSLVKTSETDPLSGLLNRRGFVDRAKAFLVSGAHFQQVFLLIADLDHFKSINDRYGHDAGDRVIKAFGDLLSKVATGNASIARIGGEEFAIMLTAPNSAAARLLCESIRNAAELGAADKDRDLPRFTVSIGLAGMVTGEPLNELMRRADLALYRAKQDGRNRVVAAETSDLSDLLVPAAA